ncbi:hypothetical protein CW304_04400 [Bacillus sp. UFRGS-B20]|nr:hypothetical protein CW304_04400 [Bacillus sp. UFRGS-B20]
MICFYTFACLQYNCLSFDHFHIQSFSTGVFVTGILTPKSFKFVLKVRLHQIVLCLTQGTCDRGLLLSI